jgi:hypothetical protein
MRRSSSPDFKAAAAAVVAAARERLRRQRLEAGTAAAAAAEAAEPGAGPLHTAGLPGRSRGSNRPRLDTARAAAVTRTHTHAHTHTRTHTAGSDAVRPGSAAAITAGHAGLGVPSAVGAGGGGPHARRSLQEPFGDALAPSLLDGVEGLGGAPQGRPLGAWGGASGREGRSPAVERALRVQGGLLWKRAGLDALTGACRQDMRRARAQRYVEACCRLSGT